MADSACAWHSFELALRFDDYADESWQKSETHFYRGLLLAGQGKQVEAIQEYEQVISLNPASYWGRVYLAQVLWCSGQQDAAIERLLEAIILSPKVKSAYLLLGKYYGIKGMIREERATFIKVLEIDPSDEIAREALDNLR